MNFTELSTKIIKQSINTAVYIDDHVLLPFEPIRDGLKNQSELFYSFKDNNCYLDFVRFDSNSPQDIGQLLSNKDLLILDWHLHSNEDNLEYTFDILKTAIKTASIHFAVIYTDQRKELLPQNVILNIGSYFSGLTQSVADESRENFYSWLDASGISQEEQTEFAKVLVALTTELFFEFKNKEKNKEISKSIGEHLDKFSLRKSFNQFLEEQRYPRDVLKEKLVCLAFSLGHCQCPDSAQEFKIHLSPDRFTIRINNLFIKVFSKDGFDQHLYGEFTKSLMGESNIFLTLLGLEIRNKFRESSGFIGKDLDDVNPLAFFQHRANHFEDNEDLFNEFLKDIWKDQVSSFLLEKDIELFSVVNEFRDSNGINEKLLSFDGSSDDSRNSIARLNYVYNRLAINRKDNAEIRFGDVFWSEVGDNMEIYLICLTPHCDCLRPGKIKNMFYFVEGTDIGISKGVVKTDGDFISYIFNRSNQLTCIDWTNGTNDCKPFSFYIENNRLSGAEQQIVFNYRGENKTANYLCSLKENYAQRIANKAFSYPTRVGIDFASLSR